MRLILYAILAITLSSVAIAMPVNPYSPDGIASTFSEDDVFYVLLTDGMVYTLEYQASNQWRFWGDLSTFPLVNIVDFRGQFLKMSDGTYWGVSYAQHPNNQTIWNQLAPFPNSGVIPTENTSFGDLKALFK